MYELTPKELDTLILLAQGKSNKEIAEVRFVNVRTVESQIRTTLQATNCSSRCHLIALFLNKKEEFILKGRETKRKTIIGLVTQKAEISPQAIAAKASASYGYTMNVIRDLKAKPSIGERTPEWF